MSADTGMKLSPLQRTTIERLERAAREPVAVTLWADARAESLVAAKQLCADLGTRLTVTALLAWILARTAADHPAINTTLTESELVRHDSVALGIAVAQPDGGLTVPVVHDADKLGLVDLSKRIDDVVNKARAGTLVLSDVRGGVITLSNVGAFGGGIHGTPIIPPQQTAIVLVAGLTSQPVVGEKGIEVGQVLPISLAFDHRILNGEAAMRFLADLIARVETVADVVSEHQKSPA
jgi:pyruvate/2-oxoglutarate dehydrogenase complex dihydrolipoamide acyltransferase (E2) component